MKNLNKRDRKKDKYQYGLIGDIDHKKKCFLLNAL
jgi:hypothetical protein